MICWVDIETTGLDPGKDAVLEIACVITDMQGVEVASINSVRRWSTLSKFDRDRLIQNLDATEMHVESGLLRDMRELTERGDQITSFYTEIQALIEVHAPEGLLGGSSVHFDRSFLARRGVLAGLSHRHVDVSSICRLFEASGLESPRVVSKRPHRAMYDVKASIATYRRALEMMGGLQ